MRKPFLQLVGSEPTLEIRFVSFRNSEISCVFQLRYDRHCPVILRVVCPYANYIYHVDTLADTKLMFYFNTSLRCPSFNRTDNKRDIVENTI